MSTSHAAGPSDAHAHDDFDPEPTNELSPGEPRTPLWLSAIGAALFLLGAVYFLLPDATDAAAVGAVDVAAGEVAAPDPAPPAARVAPVAPIAQDGPTRNDGASAAMKLTPAQIAELRKRVEEMRQQGAVPKP